MSEPQEITPAGSSSKVYLDTTPIPAATVPALDESEALRDDAVQKLMADFGFSEAMANAVVGT